MCFILLKVCCINCRELFGIGNIGINFDKYEDIFVEVIGENCFKNIEIVSDFIIEDDRFDLDVIIILGVL